MQKFYQFILFRQMKKENPKVKILIAYHKDTYRFKSDILTPIHVGRAIADKKTKKQLSDIIGDDTGDNISKKNPHYCELTALYWAWKNYDKLDNPDYIGFMHYRRHLIFNTQSKLEEDEWGLIQYNRANPVYVYTDNLDDESIKKIVNKYDLIF